MWLRVIGDRGWDPCNISLQELLAAADEKSTLALRYFQVRERFDAVLAEAWRRHPEAANDDDLRYQRLDPTTFRLAHDIQHDAIWRDDGLQAELTPIPMEACLSLYTLILEFTRDQPGEMSNETRR